jgi:hypothetical protein
MSWFRRAQLGESDYRHGTAVMVTQMDPNFNPPSASLDPPRGDTMTNHLAVELRQIVTDLDQLDDHHFRTPVRRRLLTLIENVERLHDESEPAELESAGLDPEQEIRARALDAVARLFTGAPPTTFGATELAEDFAGYIRDGARP